MLIRVLRFRGRASDTVIEANFTDAGGTIGRSSQCTLLLPDPERHISRIQAEINWSGSQFMLIARGSANCVQLNGETVNLGQAAPLRDGDELHIGDYVLRVELASTTPAHANSGPPFDPFASLVPPSVEPVPIASDHPFARPPNRPDALIPDDFDPLSKSCMAPVAVSHDATQPGAIGQGPPENENLDFLFGLGAQAGGQRDTGSPLATPISEPNTAATADPFLALNSRPAAAEAAISDHAFEINNPIRLPEERVDASGGFRSWTNPGVAGSSAIANNAAPLTSDPNILSSKHSPGDVNATQTLAQQKKIQAYKRLPGEPVPVVSLPPAEPTGANGGQQTPAPAAALLDALLAGAGLSELPRDRAKANQSQRQLDQQIMQRLGSLLKVFAQGAIDLLATRATLKTEMRSAMTIIAPRGNNPLKFSPDSTAALALLLAERTPHGFMAPEDAVQDAMNDLVAHQVGVIAGMQAALQGLLKRFQPAALEARIANRSLLDSMLPMNRKARLWEQFENTFNEVSKEAEDDFETLFGREFVRAYEAQIKALEERDSINKPER